MIIYVAEQIKSYSTREDGTVETAAELIGVFDSKEKAEAACTGLWDIVMPVEMNKVAPRETTENSDF